MKKDFVVFDFLRFSVPNKIAFGRTVVSKMSLIVLFENPDVAYAVVIAIIDKLERYYMSSRGGDHEQIALMYQAELEFDEAFRTLGKQVDRIAKGDAAIILSTGFHLAKQPTPPEISDFSVEAGEGPGSVWLHRKAVAGAASYVWMYYVGTDIPTEDKWLFAYCTTQTWYEMKGLTSASKVWFRVSAVLPTGMLPYSEPVVKVIQ
jgi:hypothetical protein